MKFSHLSALAIGAAVAFLALTSAAQAPQKTPTPSGLVRGQTEERIKQLESRADAAEKAAANAAMEKDYITRVQKEYESYYEKAYNSMLGVVGIIGLIIAVISWVITKFSIEFFDHRVESAVTKARDDVTAAMKIELDILRKENAAQNKELNSALTAQIARVNQDLEDRSQFLFLALQGQVMGAADRFADATISFRYALELYQTCKPRHLITTRHGVITVNNLFMGLRNEHPDTYMEEAKQELAKPLYDSLDGELASSALEVPWLAPLIKERKTILPTPPQP